MKISQKSLGSQRNHFSIFYQSCQLLMNVLFTYDIATRSDENEQNSSQANMKLFRSSLDLPHKHEDTPEVRSDGKNTMLLFCY